MTRVIFIAQVADDQVLCLPCWHRQGTPSSGTVTQIMEQNVSGVKLERKKNEVRIRRRNRCEGFRKKGTELMKRRTSIR